MQRVPLTVVCVRGPLVYTGDYNGTLVVVYGYNGTPRKGTQIFLEDTNYLCYD